MVFDVKSKGGNDQESIQSNTTPYSHLVVCSIQKKSQNGPFSVFVIFSKNDLFAMTYHYPLRRAYPGSEFVVANTLAKWKKLGQNEINLSQGFGQKVSG